VIVKLRLGRHRGQARGEVRGGGYRHALTSGPCVIARWSATSGRRRGRAPAGIERPGHSGTVLIPEPTFETHVHMPADLALDAVMQLALGDVDQPRLGARFRMIAYLRYWIRMSDSDAGAGTSARRDLLLQMGFQV
jgi:hypothetical protein